VVRKVGRARNTRQPLRVQPLLAQMEVAQDRFGMREERIRRRERRREDTQLASLDESAESHLLFRVTFPEDLQEEDALDAVHTPRLLLERLQYGQEDGPQSLVEVLIRRLQPVRVPVTALREQEDALRVSRNPEPLAQHRLALGLDAWFRRARKVRSGSLALHACRIAERWA